MSTERKHKTVSRSGWNAPLVRCEKSHGQANQGEMQILARGRVENSLRELGYLAGGCRARRPHHDVEFRRERHEPTGIAAQALGELQGGAAAGFQHLREFPAPHERQQALCSPQRHRRSARPGTFQADFAEMQLGRSEISVRRFVLVDRTDAGIAKQHATAAVRLQSVLVRVNDDRIRARPSNRS